MLKSLYERCRLCSSAETEGTMSPCQASGAKMTAEDWELMMLLIQQQEMHPACEQHAVRLGLNWSGWAN